MVQAISDFFLETVGRAWSVLICSMLPIIELRGGIPLGAAFGLEWWQSYALAVVGNMIPVPFILIFITRILEGMRKSRVSFFNRVAGWLDRKVEKRRGKIESYAFWGLCFFIAIPLPVTGAWTGSLIAATIEMKFWRAMLTAFLGVLISGVIVTLGAYGAVAAFKLFL